MMRHFAWLFGFWCLGAILVQPLFAQTRTAFAAEREHMVKEYIAAEGVSNPRVLESMRAVPRHVFVKHEYRMLAYHDQAVDIGHKQTISAPFIVAYMTEMIDPQPTDRVLEIGTGSGYQAAVLSSLVQDVFTIEIVEPLGKHAAKTLELLEYKNVHCRIGDGYQGWPDEAPFDKIIVTCSPENIPVPLVEQLKEGGKMIIPLGERYQQVFHLLEKKEGKLEQTKLIPTLFVPMTGRSEEMRSVKPDPQHPHIVNGGFESSTLSPGQADGWHYQRRGTLIQTDAPEGKQFICFENNVPGRAAHALQANPIDGTQLGTLEITCQVKTEDVHPGHYNSEIPGFVVHFFDGNRLPIRNETMGPWLAYSEWTKVKKVINVPANAREMIFQVGLNGGIGKVCVDDIAIHGIARIKK